MSVATVIVSCAACACQVAFTFTLDSPRLAALEPQLVACLHSRRWRREFMKSMELVRQDPEVCITTFGTHLYLNTTHHADAG